jgi:hypothetical protein
MRRCGGLPGGARTDQREAETPTDRVKLWCDRPFEHALACLNPK